jgi:hypothetical protein
LFWCCGGRLRCRSVLSLLPLVDILTDPYTTDRNIYAVQRHRPARGERLVWILYAECGRVQPILVLREHCLFLVSQCRVLKVLSLQLGLFGFHWFVILLLLPETRDSEYRACLVSTRVTNHQLAISSHQSVLAIGRVGPCYLIIFCAVMTRKASTLRKETGIGNIYAEHELDKQAPSYLWKTALVRPFVFLSSEPLTYLSAGING